MVMLRLRWTAAYLRDPGNEPRWTAPRRKAPALVGALAAAFVGGMAVAGGSAPGPKESPVVAPADMTERTDLIPKDRKRVASVTRPATDFTKPEAFEAMSGGAATTTKLVNHDSFSQSSANLKFEEEETFKLGNALFRKL